MADALGTAVGQLLQRLFADSAAEREGRAKELLLKEQGIAQVQQNLIERKERGERFYPVPTSEVIKMLERLQRECDDLKAKRKFQRWLDALAQPHCAGEG